MSETEQYRVGDLWPLDQPGAEPAAPVLVCYCGGHVEATGGTCESCGRTFDHQGRRVIDTEDLDSETGELLPVYPEFI